MLTEEMLEEPTAGLTTMPIMHTDKQASIQDEDNYTDITEDDYERFYEEHKREIAEEDADEAERLEFMPSEEEIEDRLNHPDYYQECLQYVRTTHTSKYEAIENKKKACTQGNWSSHSFCFEDLVEHHRNGMTVRHLPPQPGQPWSTRFLFIDIDNKPQPGHQPPNISAEELDAVLPTLGYEATAYTKSTSNILYKWHIFLLLSTPAKTKEEYDNCRIDADNKLRTALAALRGIKSLPALADPKVHWQSSLYAPSQSERHDFVLGSWVYSKGQEYYVQDMAHMERTISNPTPRTKSDIIDNYFKDTLVPLTASKFCAWLCHAGLTTVERIDDFEYDFNLPGTLPYVRKGAQKETDQIKEGERHMRISAFMLKIYAQSRSYNLYMDEHGFGDHKFNDDDIVDSFKHYVEKAFDTAGGYNLDRHVVELKEMISKHRSMSDREYLESVAKYTSGRHRFRTRLYTSMTAEKICEQYRTANGEVEFDSVQFRKSYLKDQRVSLPTLKKVASSKGLKISTANGSRGGARVGAGRNAYVTWEMLKTKGELVNGVFYYVEQISTAEKKFIQREGKKVKKKKGTNQRRKYRRVLSL